MYWHAGRKKNSVDTETREAPAPVSSPAGERAARAHSKAVLDA
eukprot:COSAG02_NODE_3396_length_6813_cov_7.067024_1_plen_42_part_10